MKRAVVLALVLVLVVSALIAVAVVAWNPIRLEVSFLPNGGYSIRGGHYSGALFDYLQRGPRPPNQPPLVEVRESYPTLRLQEDSFKYLEHRAPGVPATSNIRPAQAQTVISSSTPPTASYSTSNIRPADFLRGLAQIGNLILTGAKALGLLPFALLTQDGVAAGCTGTGNCFWVGGTGNFSSTAHWATTSGGATTGGLPGATDAVTFDASSGAGTATNDVASFSSAAVTMTNSSVTVSGSSNTWNVGGNWSDANSHFSRATSTVVFTATANLNEGTAAGGFNRLTVNASVAVTLTGTTTEVQSVLTVGNSGSILGTKNLDIFATPSIGTGVTLTVYLFTEANLNLPAVTVISLCVDAGVTTLSGTLTTTGAGAAFNSCVGGYGFEISAGLFPELVAGANTVSVGNVRIDGASAYVTSTAGGSWTVSGSWTNNSTSASWSFAAPITFNATSAQTMTFANVTQEFGGNVTFSSGNGTTFTMAGNALKVGGALQINNQTVLDTSASNFGITAGSLQIGPTFANALTARASSVSTGNFALSQICSRVTSTAGGSWTVTGTWNNTVNGGCGWSFAAPITFSASVGKTMNFDSVVQEFAGNVTFDTTAAAGITYTMAGASGALNSGGTITVQNTAGGASGPVILDTSAGNLAVTAVGFAVAALGQIVAHTSTLTTTGNVTGLGSISGGTLTFAASATWSLPSVGAVTVNGSVTVTLGANVTATTLLLNGTLAMGAFAFSFASLVVTPPGAVSSASATSTRSIQITASSGVFTFSAFSEYRIGSDGSGRFTFTGNDTVANDSVAFAFGGVPSGASVTLYEDGASLGSVIPSALSVATFSLASWGPHVIALGFSIPGTANKSAPFTVALSCVPTKSGFASVFDGSADEYLTCTASIAGTVPAGILTYIWDFGDGSKLQTIQGTDGATVTHQFSFGLVASFDIQAKACVLVGTTAQCAVGSERAYLYRLRDIPPIGAMALMFGVGIWVVRKSHRL